MTTAPFDLTPLLPAGLPPAAARWTGRPKYDFTGGNNDPYALPLEGLIAAADAVLRREGWAKCKKLNTKLVGGARFELATNVWVANS